MRDVSIDVDSGEILDELEVYEILDYLVRRTKRAKKGESDKKELVDWIKINFYSISGADIKSENIVDDFKISAFSEAMTRFTLDEIESRLKP